LLGIFSSVSIPAMGSLNSKGSISRHALEHVFVLFVLTLNTLQATEYRWQVDRGPYTAKAGETITITGYVEQLFNGDWYPATGGSAYLNVEWSTNQRSNYNAKVVGGSCSAQVVVPHTVDCPQNHVACGWHYLIGRQNVTHEGPILLQVRDGGLDLKVDSLSLGYIGEHYIAKVVYSIDNGPLNMAATGKVFYARGPNPIDRLQQVLLPEFKIPVGANGGMPPILIPVDSPDNYPNAKYIQVQLDGAKYLYESNRGNNALASKIDPQPVGTVSFCVWSPEFTTRGTGHAWTMLERDGIPTVSWGFYPGKSRVLHLWGGSRGVITNKEHLTWRWGRRLCFRITQEGVDAYSNAIEAIKKKRPFYHLYDYNCTHFALDVAHRMALDVPIFSCYAVSPWCFDRTLKAIVASGGHWKSGWVEESSIARTLSLDESASLVDSVYDYGGLAEACLRLPDEVSQTLGIELTKHILSPLRCGISNQIEFAAGSFDVLHGLVAIDWGDGTDLDLASTTAAHRYSTNGEYHASAIFLDEWNLTRCDWVCTADSSDEKAAVNVDFAKLYSGGKPYIGSVLPGSVLSEGQDSIVISAPNYGMPVVLQTTTNLGTDLWRDLGLPATNTVFEVPADTATTEAYFRLKLRSN
jgi:hypothetical protein